MTHRRLGALAALVLLVVAACSPGPGSGGILEGTKWVLNAVAVGGVLTVVPETEYADAEFTSRQVSGFAGCNTFDASYRAGGRTLFVTRPRTTLMACPEPALGLEQAYLNALENSRFYTARADNLTIYDGDRNTILTFDAAPRNPLLGKWLVAGYGTPPSTVNGILPGTELDVAFGIVAIGGSAGCNTFSGTYGTNGDIVRVSQLATTRLACEQPIMDQETAFLAALQGVARIDSQGPRVNLEDRDGHALVQLVRPSEVEPEASASPSAVPSASAAPSASASAKPTATPTPKPTATPTPKPTAAPTPKPTAAPTATPTTAPSPSASASAPPSFPPTGTCDLLPAAGGAAVANLVYPGSWFTLAEPPELACRYFDPVEIVVPADPATLDTAVRADLSATPYADAVAAASDPANWTVAASSSFAGKGAPVTCVTATALTATAGIPVGEARSACFADLKTSGTVVIWAHGTPDQAFVAEAGVVTLMTFLSTFVAPPA